MSDPFQQPIGAQPPLPPAPTDPALEYVSGGTGLWSKTQSRSLPWAFDDISSDFGDDIYRRMLLDSAVSAAINTLKTGIIEEGLGLRSAIDDHDDPQYDKAQEIAQFCDANLSDLETPIDDVLWDMLDSLALGARVAEKIYTPSGGKLILRAVKVKPRRATAFVVDAYMNLVGLLALIPGQGYGVQVGTTIVGDPAKQPQLLPKAKFCVLSNRPQSNDPRGTSLLRPAYGAWWMKQQIWPEYLKYLAVWATPTAVGTTPERANEVYDSVSGVKISAVQALLNSLLSLKNNSALAVPFGTAVQMFQATGDGKVFEVALDILDRQITTGVLYQTLATMEGQHQSRAASSTHKSTLDTIVRQAKRAVCGMLRRDVLRELVRVNYGEAAARDLTPIPSLGSVEAPDRAGMLTAVATAYRYGYIDDSQKAGLDAELNLPARTPLESVDEEPQDAQGETNAGSIDEGQDDQPPQDGQEGNANESS
jgi:hypothetical protein